MGAVNSIYNRCLYRSKLEDCVADICQHCPPNVLEMKGNLSVSPSLLPNVQLGIKKMRQMTLRLNGYTLSTEEQRDLLLAGLFFAYFFWANLKITLDKKGKQTRNNYVRSRTVLGTLLGVLIPYSHSEVLETASEFLTVNRLWKSQVYIRDLCQLLLICKISNDEMFMRTFRRIEENVTTDLIFSKLLLSAAYDVLLHRNMYKLKNVQYMTFVVQLRDMFRASMSSEIPNYSQLQRGINVCLRQICHQLKYEDLLQFIGQMIDSVFVVKLTDDDVLEFATILEYAAILHKTIKLTDLENENIFKNTLELMASQNSFLSLLGCRLLQYFLDRHGNRKTMVTPMVFFTYSEISVRVGLMEYSDMEFIDKYKISIQDSIMSVISNHNSKIANMSHLFGCMALISLEVPCGLTAAWSCWVGVKIQDFALKTPLLSKVVRHRLHALALAVISVPCWVHDADILHKHIGDIAARRANEAPHLIPPLRTHYTYAQYHITWDKPDLFMDEWELRYGLWKTFNVLKTKKIRSRIPWPSRGVSEILEEKNRKVSQKESDIFKYTGSLSD